MFSVKYFEKGEKSIFSNTTHILSFLSINKHALDLPISSVSSIGNAHVFLKQVLITWLSKVCHTLFNSYNCPEFFPSLFYLFRNSSGANNGQLETKDSNIINKDNTDDKNTKQSLKTAQLPVHRGLGSTDINPWCVGRQWQQRRQGRGRQQRDALIVPT